MAAGPAGTGRWDSRLEGNTVAGSDHGMPEEAGPEAGSSCGAAGKTASARLK